MDYLDRKPDRQMMAKIPHEDMATLDREARERGMSRVQFLIYLARAFENNLVLITDWNTWGKFKQSITNEMVRAARMAAREEVKLYLHEEGFTSSPYEK